MGTSIAECIRSLAGDNGAPYVKRLHTIALGENVRHAIAAIEVLLDAATARSALIWKPARGWTHGITAVGRELLGFIWAIGVRVEAAHHRAASLPA
jgi:hypothetical protein